MSAPDGSVDAIVLRMIDHGETGRIVTFYTPTLGRIAAMARGARGKSRRFSGHLDLFHRGEATLKSSRRGGLATLAEFSAGQLYDSLRQDLERFATASFFVELVLMSTVDHDPAADQFALIAEALETVATSDRPLRPDVILSFQLRWFDALGELPDLSGGDLADAHLPHLDDGAIAVARALSQGVNVRDLDEARFRAVGALTRALRHRISGRPMASSTLLSQLLSDAWN